MSDRITNAERRRRILHQEILDFTGHPAYFQPPSTPNKAILTYPCTVYNLDAMPVNQADDMNYTVMRRYQITYITKDPADPLIDEFLEHFRNISFNRHFTSDNLNHYIYSILY